MTSYCWGDRLVPWPIQEFRKNSVVVQIDGEPTEIRGDRIRGYCEDGDPLRVLVSGGYWHPARIVGYDLGLKIAFKDGGQFRTQSVARLNFDPTRSA
jgi:hypothetical protein